MKNNVQRAAGDLLILFKAAETTEKRFLLTGDSFYRGRYITALEVFAYFSQEGSRFQLEIFAPGYLKKDLCMALENLGLNGKASILENPPENLEPYEEVIRVPDFLGRSLLLQKTDQLIDGTAVSLRESLKGSLGR